MVDDGYGTPKDCSDMPQTDQPLTRKQFLQRAKRLHGGEWADISTHDNAQRAELVAQAQKIKRLREAIEFVLDSRHQLLRTFVLWAKELQEGKMALREVEELREELAQCQRERDALVIANKYFAISEERLHQQLTTAQATIAQAREALEEIAASARGDPNKIVCLHRLEAIRTSAQAALAAMKVDAHD